MRILHVNTDELGGGAARAINRIHRGLLALGEDSSLLVFYKSSADPTVIRFDPSHAPVSRLRRRVRARAISRDARRYLHGRPQGYELFSDDRTPIGRELVHSLPDADIVSLNWVARFLDVGSFFPALSRSQQIVWRLSDAYPFTGGCHCNFGCPGYIRSCGNCPQLASSGLEDLSGKIWARKKKAYESLTQSQLSLVALSTSQAKQVRQSSLLGRFPISVIPPCVDAVTFSPRPQASARSCLGLDTKKPIILMVASDLNRRNKGAETLATAVSLMDPARRPYLLTVGAGGPRATQTSNDLDWGEANDDHLLALLYSAADLLAFPSLQEAGGQTILEALACGLPVVGFDSGVMRDAVRPGITGHIAESKTPESLSEALQLALEDTDRLRGMREACRATAEERFSIEVVARRYQELYQTLLEAKDTQQD
jgi:glycosyltransferase involved in cell wall biosynthesis